MASDPPLEARRTDLPIQFATFQERLLSAGSDGFDDFKLIQQAFPIESLLYERAITELMTRMELTGVSSTTVQQEMIEAKRLLALTLVPFIQTYPGVNQSSVAFDAVVDFRRHAKEWAMAELKSCTMYIISLVVSEQQQQLTSRLVSQEEADQLRILNEMLADVESRPEAGELAIKLKREYQDLAATIARRRDVDPLVPKSLSYIMLCCSRGGYLRDIALAALIMRGNNSPGANATKNPLQILEVDDVAVLLEVDNSTITNNVSKLRSKAMSNTDLKNFRYDLDVRNLWTYIEPAVRSSYWTRG